MKRTLPFALTFLAFAFALGPPAFAIGPPALDDPATNAFPFKTVELSPDGKTATIRFVRRAEINDANDRDTIAVHLARIQRALGVPVVPRNYEIVFKPAEGVSHLGEPWFTSWHRDKTGKRIPVKVHEEVASIWSGPPEEGNLVRQTVELASGSTECTKAHAAFHIEMNGHGYHKNEHPAFVHARDGRQLLISEILGGDCWCPGVCTIDPAEQFDLRPSTQEVTRVARRLGVLQTFRTVNFCPVE